MNLPVLAKIKTEILNPFIAFLMVLAFIYFLYGLVKFVANYDNVEARTAGKNHMLWGVVGLAIMVSVYGLLAIIKATISGIAG